MNAAIDSCGGDKEICPFDCGYTRNMKYMVSSTQRIIVSVSEAGRIYGSVGYEFTVHII